MSSYYNLDMWKNAIAFNKMMDESTCDTTTVYILLITKSNCFNIEEDIGKTLNIRNKPFLWFIQKFKDLNVRVEYFTVCGYKEKTLWGPIANDIGVGICLLKFKKIYFSSENYYNIVFVGSSFLKKLFPDDAKLISIESFVQIMLNG